MYNVRQTTNLCQLAQCILNLDDEENVIKFQRNIGISDTFILHKMKFN